MGQEEDREMVKEEEENEEKKEKEEKEGMEKKKKCRNGNYTKPGIKKKKGVNFIL